MAIDKIGTNGLVAADIIPPDGTISTAKIANDAVTSAKIGVDVIAAEDLANNSVTVAELSNNAVTTDKLNANAVTYAKISESSMRDKYFREIWCLTDHHLDDTQMIGYNTANIWALNTDYAGTDHGSYANSQRMLTPGHHGGGDTMHSGGGVTGKEFFQFPENGLYSVTTNFVVYSDGVDGAQYIRIYKNSTSTPDQGGDMARFYTGVHGVAYSNMNGEVIVNISDYVNDFISFSVYSIGTGDGVRGSAVTNRFYQSHIIFQRLGDVPS